MTLIAPELNVTVSVRYTYTPIATGRVADYTPKYYDSVKFTKGLEDEYLYRQSKKIVWKEDCSSPVNWTETAGNRTRKGSGSERGCPGAGGKTDRKSHIYGNENTLMFSQKQKQIRPRYLCPARKYNYREVDIFEKFLRESMA